jgi:hypothetical protein
VDVIGVKVYLVMPDLSRAKLEAIVRLSGELPLSILVSYSTFKLKPATLDRLRELRSRAEVEVMLDSGAYHMRRLGLDVRVEDYASFVQSNPRLFDVIVAPDVPHDCGSTLFRSFRFSKLLGNPPDVMMVLQGVTLNDYIKCYRLHRLAFGELHYVGVGGLDGARRRVGFLSELLGNLCNMGLELHLFGIGARLARLLATRGYNCVKSTDTMAWLHEIKFRRRDELGVDGNLVELNYRAMRRYLERIGVVARYS